MYKSQLYGKKINSYIHCFCSLQEPNASMATMKLIFKDNPGLIMFSYSML